MTQFEQFLIQFNDIYQIELVPFMNIDILISYVPNLLCMPLYGQKNGRTVF